MQLTPLPYKELKSRVKGKRLWIEFNHKHLSIDGGIALFNEIEDRSKIIKTACECINDRRVKGRSKFSIKQILKSRVYLIGCGYEDVNPDYAREFTFPGEPATLFHRSHEV